MTTKPWGIIQDDAIVSHCEIFEPEDEEEIVPVNMNQILIIFPLKNAFFKIPNQAIKPTKLSQSASQTLKKSSESVNSKNSSENGGNMSSSGSLRNSQNADNTESTLTNSLTNSQKPACMYGEKCYRKNPEHFAEYSHPQAVVDRYEDQLKKQAKKTPKKKLSPQPSQQQTTVSRLISLRSQFLTFISPRRC